MHNTAQDPRPKKSPTSTTAEARRRSPSPVGPRGTPAAATNGDGTAISREDSMRQLREMQHQPLFPRSTSPSVADDLDTVTEGAVLAAPVPAPSPTDGRARDRRDTSPSPPRRSSAGATLGTAPSSPTGEAAPPVLSPAQWFAREERKAIDVFLQVWALWYCILSAPRNWCGFARLASILFCWRCCRSHGEERAECNAFGGARYSMTAPFFVVRV